MRESTPAERYVVEAGLRPSRFHFNTEVYRALEDETLDVVVDDLSIGAWFAAQSGADLRATPLDGTDAPYAIVVGRQAAAFKTELDDALGSVMSDGTYARLYACWLQPIVGNVRSDHRERLTTRGRSRRPAFSRVSASFQAATLPPPVEPPGR